VTVAYQGEPGAYSEAAALALAPQGAPRGYAQFADAFEALARGEAERAVVPVENSLFGSVHVCYDLLRAHRPAILAEHVLPIAHRLMALPGTTLADVREVRSHPQALGQCAGWLRAHLPTARIVADYDTAGAAQRVRREGLSGVAAIASARAAEVYGLHVLATGVADAANATRFLLLAPPGTPAREGQPRKTSVSFALPDMPGALFKCLAVFALREIDLLKIESRPLPGQPGRYLFYLDLAGSDEDAAVARALDHLEEVAEDVHRMGSFPAAA
jgi:prephenate dehydratase